MATIVILLVGWLGLNAAFVAIRLYVTDNQSPRAEPVRYEGLLN